MSVSYFVLYKGQAVDPQAFLGHYRDVHVPILGQWPGIRSVSLHRPADWRDTQSVDTCGLALMAQMTFDDLDALDCALRSEARLRAREDFHRFPPFNGEVRHQAMVSERLV